ncbi:Mettl16 [Acrasis kona]|uniref:Mettl16 n=1 Tax=Acrasis kona TaxID=1008807 RepID=A0AAW2Z5D7_9EUKA
MHRNNKYHDKAPDFNELSTKYPSLLEFLVEGRSYDWKNPIAMVELTKILLLEDYGIKWDLPTTHLCPPVTNRANYILWMNDLLEMQSQKNQEIIGIDVGTGASCIYPLLGSKMFNWNFVGTDIDENSITHAKKLVDMNEDLNSKISLIHVQDCSNILINVIDINKKYDFVVCNPPFFSSEEESEKRNPKTSRQATNSELQTTGGEVSFVCRMIDDSVSIGTNITWYSTMLGKKSSIKPIKQYLSSCNISLIYTTEFVQGKTQRWGLAWNMHPESTCIQKPSSLVVSKIMTKTVFHYSSAAALFKTIAETVQGINNVTIKKKDVLGGTVLLSVDESSVSIKIMQLQPKQYVVEVKFLGKDLTNSYQNFYEHFSRIVYNI